MEKVSGVRFQVSAPPAQPTAGQIEKKTYEHRTLNIEHPIWMTLRFVVF
ncbi:hypothetical protein D1AOALGA4SA_11325 [Olavius algarvensis Delta 1 endosymbiont]|nr:hypothetical protein D1AOALGA4SA_11325 [Olavius algarvensis Delta 1 endosymbiont]